MITIGLYTATLNFVFGVNTGPDACIPAPYRSLKPSWAKAWTRKALAHLQLKQFDDAAKACVALVDQLHGLDFGGLHI